MATAQKNPKPTAVKTAVDEAREAIKKAKEAAEAKAKAKAAQTLKDKEAAAKALADSKAKKAAEQAAKEAQIQKINGKELLSQSKFRALVKAAENEEQLDKIHSEYTAITRKGKENASYLSAKGEKQIHYTNGGKVIVWRTSATERTKKVLSFSEAWKSRKTFSNNGNRLFWKKDKDTEKKYPCLKTRNGELTTGNDFPGLMAIARYCLS